MRERTFERPTIKKVLEISGIEDIPARVTLPYINKLISNGTAIFVEEGYENAVRTIEQLPRGKIVVLSDKFRVKAEDSNYGIKSLANLVKIDSVKVLKALGRGDSIPSRLTKEFAEENRLKTEKYIAQAMAYTDVENPVIGPYWIGADGHARAFTFLSATDAVEMVAMRAKGDFEGEVIDNNPYGKNISVKVNSRTKKGKEYEFTLSRLPLHIRGDKEQYSSWINIFHDSNDPDARYRGKLHNKQKHPTNLWSATAIFGYYTAMSFVAEHPEWLQFKSNPFSIPKNQSDVDFTDKSRLKTIIISQDYEGTKIKTTNKTEISRLQGARTRLRGYENCWVHMGKQDVTKFYQPIR